MQNGFYDEMWLKPVFKGWKDEVSKRGNEERKFRLAR